MGVLTDIVVADASEAEAVCQHSAPYDGWPGGAFKGFGPEPEAIACFVGFRRHSK